MLNENILWNVFFVFVFSKSRTNIYFTVTVNCFQAIAFSIEITLKGNKLDFCDICFTGKKECKSLFYQSVIDAFRELVLLFS